MVGIQTCNVDAKLEPVYVGPWNLVLIDPHMFCSLAPYTFVGQYQCFGETRFTMETETGGHIPFLDIDIYRKLNGHSRHRAYRKHTHTNLYLNATSHHHLTTSRLCSAPWFTGPRSSVIPTVSHKNLNSNMTPSATTVRANSSRFSELSIYL
jgi:hypothetical protein